MGGRTQSARIPKGAVSVAHGAESTAVMWSIFFVFLSYLDRDLVKAGIPNRAVDAEKETKEMFSSLNGTVCAKMLIDGGNFLYRVSDGVEIVQSVVSPSGKVVNCSVLVNQMQVKSFMRKCKLGLKVQEAAQQMDARFAHMDEAKLMCREFKENTERSDMIEDDNDHSEKVFKRSKRGFTYPGTLWCGAGNTADHYNQLGNVAFPNARRIQSRPVIRVKRTMTFLVQENLRRQTAAAGSTTTVPTSSTPSLQGLATPISNGTPSATATAMRSE